VTDSDQTWAVDLFGEALDVEWKREGDEWIHHVFVALGEKVPMTGHGERWRPAEDGVPAQHVRYTAISDELNSFLRVVPLDDGVYVFVTGAGNVPNAAEVDPWGDAVREAVRRIGQDHRVFSWNAVIGPRPGMHGIGQVVDAEAEISGLRVRPGGVLLYEDTQAGFPSFGVHSSFWSAPAIVTGEARGYSWVPASGAAANELHRLCALLSVAWDAPWVIRQAASPDENGEPWIPERLPFEAPWHEGIDPSGWIQEPVSIPDWASEGWERIEGDRILEDALGAHHQAVLLHEGHPSFALLGYVGAIEGIGAKLIDLDRCEACGTRVGSAERFRSALRLVRAETEVRALARLYTSRSLTAHKGKLHGSEATVGAIPRLGLNIRDDKFHFAFGSLYALRRASRDLLLTAIKGSLPDRV
jgi:hypothetical protein